MLHIMKHTEVGMVIMLWLTDNHQSRLFPIKVS